jgi:3-oxoacyl-[acyl-carrier-protein] synthase-1
MNAPLQFTAITLVSAIGRGMAATAEALREQRSGLVPCNFDGLTLDAYIGIVPGLEQAAVLPHLQRHDCRNNRLAQMALQTDDFEGQVRRAIGRYGAGRIATVVGTTSSGIQEAEHAYAQRQSETESLRTSFDFEHSQSHFSVTAFVRDYLGLRGPAYTVSTACSSSNKVFADARQLIAVGACDAAVVGGVDSLCWMSLCGFNSLQLLSRGPCRPNSADRDGLSIGEAAGFALLEREPIESCGVKLLGCGESCDAHHMSAPHPEGLGAITAMRRALAGAGKDAGEIDYVNLHGTGTPANDRAEDMAVTKVFGPDQLASSTKGWTGHTLGAAGMTEVAISVLCLLQQFLPANLNLTQPDPEFRMKLVRQTLPATVGAVLTNSFGFGGSNCALVLGL